MILSVFREHREHYFNPVDLLTGNTTLYFGSFQTISYPCLQHLCSCNYQTFGADPAQCQPHSTVDLPTGFPHGPAQQPYTMLIHIRPCIWLSMDICYSPWIPSHSSACYHPNLICCSALNLFLNTVENWDFIFLAFENAKRT